MMDTNISFPPIWAYAVFIGGVRVSSKYPTAESARDRYISDHPEIAQSIPDGLEIKTCERFDFNDKVRCWMAIPALGLQPGWVGTIYAMGSRFHDNPGPTYDLRPDDRPGNVTVDRGSCTAISSL